MKKLIAFMVLALSTVSHAVDLEVIKDTVRHLQPKLRSDDKVATQVAKGIHTACKTYGLDWKLFTSLLNQESSLNKDPQGCLNNSARCTGDYGIGQVRISVWEKVEGMKFDRIKMLTDLSYAIDASARVLHHYKVKYETRELNWFTRYHSGTTEFRAKYISDLNRSFSKINTYLEGYVDGVKAAEEGRSFLSGLMEGK